MSIEEIIHRQSSQPVDVRHDGVGVFFGEADVFFFRVADLVAWGVDHHALHEAPGDAFGEVVVGPAEMLADGASVSGVPWGSLGLAGVLYSSRHRGAAGAHQSNRVGKILQVVRKADIDHQLAELRWPYGVHEEVGELVEAFHGLVFNGQFDPFTQHASSIPRVGSGKWKSYFRSTAFRRRSSPQGP